MGREAIKGSYKKVHVCIMANQVRDMQRIKEVTGKTRTDCINEALGVWLRLMRQEKVI